MPRSTSLPLPKGWTKVVRTGVLHAISLASKPPDRQSIGTLIALSSWGRPVELESR